MTLDIMLVALYIGALISTPKNRDAFIALFFFAAACAIASGVFQAPYQYHLCVSLIYIIAAMSTRKHSLRTLFFVIILYQYGMGLDAFLWPATETYLYKSYQYVAFLLNLIVIGHIGGGYGVSTSRDTFHLRWRFNFPRISLHSASKAGLKKGEAR